MRCPNCNTVLREGDKFCSVCGTSVESASEDRCSCCGEKIRPGAAFCPSCGNPLKAQPKSPARVGSPAEPSPEESAEKAALKAQTETLVRNAQAGDPDGFSELYRLYYQKVYALAKTTVKTDADAEDVLQMTFLKVWNNLDKLKNPGAFSTWIQRITLNQCYSLMRKKHPEISIDRDRDDDEDNAPIQLESDLLLPEVYAERNDLRARLGKIVHELSDVQRQTIDLYYYDGLPVENIAWIMGCSVNTVKSRLFLARKSIKTEIEEQERRSGQPFFGIVGLGLIPFGKLFFAETQAASLSQAAASQVFARIAGGIAAAANAAAAGGGAAAKTGVGAAAKAGAGAATKTGAGAAAKAGAGTTAKVAAAAASKKVIAGVVAAVIGTGAVAGGTVATVSAVRSRSEDKPAIIAEATEDPYAPFDFGRQEPTDPPAWGGTAAPEPIVTETPEPGLSETARAAYRAYIKVLEDNRAVIDAYTWQKNDTCYSYQNDYGDNEAYEAGPYRAVSRPVALRDIDGDGLFELLYCAPDEPTDTEGDFVRLHIVDWVDGAAKTVYVDNDDDLFTHGEEDYVYYQLEGEQTLYQQYSGGDDEGTWYWIARYMRQPDGTFAIEKIGERAEDREIAYELMSTYNRSERKLAMTADEAIEYLRGLLDGNPDAQPEEAVFNAAFRAYRDYLREHRAEINAYIWQEEGWDEAFEWLSDDPDNWNDPGYYDLNRLVPGAVRPVPRAVALYNIVGDTIPELILLRGPDSTRFDYNTFSRLTILTYRSGQLVTLYDGDWNRLESFEGAYEFRIIAGSGAHKLIGFWTDGMTLYWENTYYVFTETADGLLERTTILTDYHEDADGEEEEDYDRREYRGTAVDEQTYRTKLFELYAERSNQLICSGCSDGDDQERVSAMTCDGMIAYLDAMANGAGAEPSAYNAYFSVLEGYRSDIEWYEETMRAYFSYLPDYGTPKTVALRDVYGDDTPELLFLLQDESDTFQEGSGLVIATFENGKIKFLFSGPICSDNIEERFYLYQLPGEKTLYLYDSSGHDRVLTETHTAFVPDGKGGLKMKEVLSITEEGRPGTGDKVYSCEIDGRKASKSDSDAKIAYIEQNQDYVFTGNLDLRGNSPKSTVPPMTYREAVDWLKNH